MRLLVHACCGPCSIMPTQLLAERGHDFTVLYSNSNIAPRAEYDKRLRELEAYAVDAGFSVIEGAYVPDEWERVVAPHGEGAHLRDPLSPDVHSVAELLDDDNRRERCRACYRMRLEEAAQVAAGSGYDALATTLAVSPYQFTDVICEELDRACRAVGVRAHFEDWRPFYAQATRISRERGMYRQNYCGCRFSIAEGEATRTFVRRQRAAKRAARAAADESRRQRAADKRAYAAERARRRAILKSLREHGSNDTPAE